MKTPADIVKAYKAAVWQQRDINTALAQFASPCWYHDTSQSWYELGTQQPTLVRSRDQQQQRDFLAELIDVAADDCQFDILHCLEDKDYVTLVWNCKVTATVERRQRAEAAGYRLDDKGSYQTKAIELFHVVDERIIEVWSASGPWLHGEWGDTQTGEDRETSEPYGERIDTVCTYVTELWNKQNASVIATYLNNPCWRHDAGEPDRQFMKFDHDFQKQRAEEGYHLGEMEFIYLKMFECGEFVTMLWDVRFALKDESLRPRMDAMGALYDDDGRVISKGFEIFRVRDNKIIEVWITQGVEIYGLWGDEKVG